MAARKFQGIAIRTSPTRTRKAPACVAKPAAKTPKATPSEAAPPQRHRAVQHWQGRTRTGAPVVVKNRPDRNVVLVSIFVSGKQALQVDPT
eukprot:14765749-Alexandrium_andersonii.AAC.1